MCSDTNQLAAKSEPGGAVWSAGAGKLRIRQTAGEFRYCLSGMARSGRWVGWLGVGLAGWGFDLLLSPSTSHLYCLQALLSLAAVKRNLRQL